LISIFGSRGFLVSCLPWEERRVQPSIRVLPRARLLAVRSTPLSLSFLRIVQADWWEYMPCLALPFHPALVPVLAVVFARTTITHCHLPSRRVVARTIGPQCHFPSRGSVARSMEATWVYRPARAIASLGLVSAPGFSRRSRRRGILGPVSFVNFAVLAATLQGHFFFVDGHGVGVGLLAAAGALVTRY
jgi:hypothetical protein